MNRTATRVYEFGVYRVDTADRRLFRDGQEVPLSPKVFDTLVLLLETPGKLVGKDELIEKLWPGTFVGEDALTQKISLLRKALNGGNGADGYISTVPKLGYRFTGELITEASPIAGGNDNSELRASSVQTAAVVGKSTKRNRSLVVGTALVILLCAAGSIWLAVRMLGRSSPVNYRITALDVSNFVHSGAISPDGKYIAYVADENGKSSIWIRQVDGAGKGLEVVSTLEGGFFALSYSPDDNYLYYALSIDPSKPSAVYRINPLGGTPQLIEGAIGKVEFDPSGQRMVYKRFTYNGKNISGSELVVARADGTDVRLVAKSRGSDTGFNGYHWSSNDTIIYAESVRRTGGFDAYVAEIPASGGKETRIIGPESAYFQTAQRWSRSEILALASVPTTGLMQVWMFDKNGGKRRVTNDTNRYTDMTASPSSRRILANRVDIEGSFWLVDSGQNPDASAQPVNAKEISIPRGQYGDVVFTPDGNLVYAMIGVNGNSELWWVRADGTGARQITSTGVPNTEQRVSPDGRFVVFVVHRNGTARIWRVNIDGSDARELTVGANDDYPQVSPDGEWVVYSSLVAGQWGVWKVPSRGGAAIRITGSVRAEAGVAPVISPDGKFIAVEHMSPVSHRQRRGIVSFQDGSLQEELDLPEHCLAVSWSHDGKSLVYLLNHRELWSQAINGHKPKMIMDLASAGEVYGFDWSRDGTKMVLLSRTVKTDMVLIDETK